MANIKVLGNSLTITSEIKAENIRNTEKYAPDCTKLWNPANYNEEPVVDFMVAMTESIGSANNNGICFDSENTDGYAYLTVGIDRTPETDEEAIIQKYAPMLVKLNSVERRIEAAMEEINKQIDAVRETVKFMD